MATSYLGGVQNYDSEEKWSNYVERLQQFFIVNDIKDDKKKTAILLSVIGASTYALLKNLVSPVCPSEKSFKEINEVLKNHFEPAVLVIAQRFKFHKREQQPGESANVFYSELKSLSQSCDFGQFLDEAIRDRFVCGLRDDKIQKRPPSRVKLNLGEGAYDDNRMGASDQRRNADGQSRPSHTQDGREAELPSVPREPHTR